jgi:hypothetical protein
VKEGKRGMMEHEVARQRNRNKNHKCQDPSTSSLPPSLPPSLPSLPIDKLGPFRLQVGADAAQGAAFVDGRLQMMRGGKEGGREGGRGGTEGSQS